MNCGYYPFKPVMNFYSRGAVEHPRHPGRLPKQNLPSPGGMAGGTENHKVGYAGTGSWQTYHIFLCLAREVHAKQYEVETCNTRHSMCANICGSIYHVDFRVYVRQIDI